MIAALNKQQLFVMAAFLKTKGQNSDSLCLILGCKERKLWNLPDRPTKYVGFTAGEEWDFTHPSALSFLLRNTRLLSLI